MFRIDPMYAGKEFDSYGKYPNVIVLYIVW